MRTYLSILMASAAGLACGPTAAGDGDTGSATTAPTTSSSADDGGSASDASGDATSGGPRCGGAEGNCQQFPPDCAAEFLPCGDLESIFDDQGCLRPSCGTDEDCAAGQRCYRPQDFGGCTGSAVFCEDDLELQTCVCGGTADCGGAYCVPAEIHPVPDPGPPGAATVTTDCAPDDGPAWTLTIGLEAPACGLTPVPGTPIVRITLWVETLAPGSYPIGGFNFPSHAASYDDGTGNLASATAGLVVITANDGATLDGTWELVLAEGATYFGGAITAAPICDAPVVCG